MCRKLMAPAHLVSAPESLANGFQASLSMSHSNTFGTTISRHSMTHNHPPTHIQYVHSHSLYKCQP